MDFLKKVFKEQRECSVLPEKKSESGTNCQKDNQKAGIYRLNDSFRPLRLYNKESELRGLDRVLTKNDNIEYNANASSTILFENNLVNFEYPSSQFFSKACFSNENTRFEARQTIPATVNTSGFGVNSREFIEMKEVKFKPNKIGICPKVNDSTLNCTLLE